MSAQGQTMVKMLFEGKNLANCDFWTKSDPYLILSRPKKGAHEFKKVNMAEAFCNFQYRSNQTRHLRIFKILALETVCNL